MAELILIDDDPLQLALLSRQLENLGYQQIALFEHAADALAAIENRQSSLDQMIFLDLNMPDMDGIEVLRRLSAINFSGSLVLVSGEEQRILTAASRLATEYELNVIGYLSKPCNVNTLTGMMARASQKRATKSSIKKHIYGPVEVQRAIEQSELVNYYQPKVCLSTGKLLGVETLVRWRHPQDGLVFPDQFISVAEEHDLIGALTRSVITMALSQGAKWRKEGLQFDLAVNVSMSDLSDLDFPDFVLTQLAQWQFPATSLCLEITESRLMTDRRLSLDILTRFRLKRINLSIDDFGTGHASMAHLHDLPFSELKIDRGFVHGAHHNETLNVILEASLDMAKKMAMTSVAEGVEDLDDWQWVKAQGVDIAQGYFISRPMPSDQLSLWLASWIAKVTQLNIAVTTSPEANSKMNKFLDNPLENLNVLLVDDDPFALKLAKQVLTDLGLEHITTAEDGQQALDLLGKSAFDLFLTDIQMPGINGLELLKHIRSGQTQAPKDLSAIIITSLSNTEILGAAMALDVNGFLVKPFKPITVVNSIVQAVNEKAFQLRENSSYLAVKTELDSLCLVETENTSPKQVSEKVHSISLLQLKPTMRLTQDVNAKTGVRLLSAGFILNERTISRLCDLHEILADDHFVVEIPA